MKQIFFFLIFTCTLTAQNNTGIVFGSSSIHKMISGAGLNVESSFITDIVSNLHGGMKRSNDYFTLFDLSVECDFKQILKIDGFTLFADFILPSGGSPGNLTGDIQGINNIEAGNKFRVYEGWIKQEFFNKKFYILAGIREYNSVFSSLNSSQIFINSSHGLGYELACSGSSTYPNTALAIEISANINANLKLKSILTERTPGHLRNWETSIFNKCNGYFFSSELEYQYDFTNKVVSAGNSSKKYNRQFRNRSRFRRCFNSDEKSYVSNSLSFKLGGWYDSGLSVDSGIINTGAYFSAEFFSKASHTHEISYFIRLGIANPNINNGQYYIGVGSTCSNIIFTDEVGLAVASAIISSEYLPNIFPYTSNSFETNFELTYKLQLNSFATIQPDFQYIINPGINKNLKNAFVFILRTEIIL